MDPVRMNRENVIHRERVLSSNVETVIGFAKERDEEGGFK
jgi:hypothetical protein